MTFRPRLAALLGAAAVAGAALGASMPFASAETQRADRAEIEAIVREYLLANPEILIEMSDKLREKEEAEKLAKAQAALGDEATQAKLYSDGWSYVAGNPNGDVTIVEFFDYRCAFCKKARPEVLKLLEDDKNVRLVLKEFPILGPVSQKASEAAMAALAQDPAKYWAFHLAMMAEDGLKEDRIYELAAAQGLDVERLKGGHGRSDREGAAGGELRSRREPRRRRHARLRDRRRADPGRARRRRARAKVKAARAKADG